MTINQEAMKAIREKMDTIQEKMEAEISSGQVMKATVRANQEKMETAINSIQSELKIIKEGVKHYCHVNQYMHYLHKENKARIEGTQMKLLLSLNTQIQRLH
jgi:exosome complex RNA-binding protein Rrp4